MNPCADTARNPATTAGAQVRVPALTGEVRVLRVSGRTHGRSQRAAARDP